MNKVFEEAHIGSIKLKNRIIRSATHEGLGDSDGFPRPELEDKYLQLARGGVGAIIAGFMGTQKNGKALANMRMFDDDRYIDDYKKITSAVRGAGAPIIAQLAHAGGQTHADITGGDVAAPTTALYRLMNARAREMNEKDIKEVIANFISAITRAKEAGFDGVQIHAAHGYLLNEFLSPFTNRRSDAWGGSTEKRFRILAEIIDGARKSAGNFPILAKLSAFDFDKGGMTADESLRIAELFQRHGLNALEVSCGGVTDGFTSVRVYDIPIEALLRLMPMIAAMPFYKKKIMKLFKNRLFRLREPVENYNIEAAENIKQSVDMPVIVVDGIRRGEDIESIINEKKADFVAMARPFIAEPDFVNKLRTNARKESACINCGYCLLGVTGNSLRCYHGRLPN